MEKLNQTQIANAIGVTKGYINKLVKQGVIKLDEDGKTTLEKAKQEIDNNSNPAYSKNKNQSMTIEDKEELIENMSDPEYLKNVFGLSYADAKTRNEQIDILINIVKLEKEQGKLVAIDEVKNEAFEIAKKLKEGLLNIPDRICDLLASENEPIRIHKILTEEIKEVLVSISEELKK